MSDDDNVFTLDTVELDALEAETIAHPAGVALAIVLYVVAIILALCSPAIVLAVWQAAL